MESRSLVNELLNLRCGTRARARARGVYHVSGKIRYSKSAIFSFLRFLYSFFVAHRDAIY